MPANTGTLKKAAQQSAAKITPLDEWIRPTREGRLVELPSGRVVRLRQINFDTALLLGDIPDVLTAMVSQIFLNGNRAIAKLAQEQQLNQYFELLNAVCVTCFVEPRVVLAERDADGEPVDPPDGSISTEMISYEDKEAVIGWLFMPSSRLIAFPQNETIPLGNLLGQQTEFADALATMENL